MLHSIDRIQILRNPKILPSSFLITALIAVSQFASASELQDKVESLTQEIMPKVIEWRRDFHAHPELSNREETHRQSGGGAPA